MNTMINEQNLAEKTVLNMFEKDAFSNWMGVLIHTVNPGYCLLSMTVREEMLNGFGILHGGITFAFADSALAFASNSYGRISLLMNANMSYPASAKKGDELMAEANEIYLSDKTAMYEVIVSNQKGEKIGVFHGTVYRTQREINVE